MLLTLRSKKINQILIKQVKLWNILFRINRFINRDLCSLNFSSVDDSATTEMF